MTEDLLTQGEALLLRAQGLAALDVQFDGAIPSVKDDSLPGIDNLLRQCGEHGTLDRKALRVFLLDLQSAVQEARKKAESDFTALQ